MSSEPAPSAGDPATAGPDPAAAGDPEPDRSAVSRRVLLGGGLLVLGAVGGAAVGFVRTDPPRRTVPDAVPPADVLAALDREQRLLATYDAALAATPDPLWAHVRAEHAAHAAALTALLPAASGSATDPTPGATSTTPSTATSTPAAAPPVAADLVAAEQAAATAARTACLAGNGTAAVLLAGIAASESSHAAVLA